MQLKVADIIRFRFKGSNAQNDWSPPALVLEKFDIFAEDRPKVWVVLCDGVRCMANEETHEIELLSPSDFFPVVSKEGENECR